jgi:hypothetical protein
MVRPRNLTPTSPTQRTCSYIHLGAVYVKIPAFPNLGAFHGSECKFLISSKSYRHSNPFRLFVCDDLHSAVPILFGTFDNSTASAEEAELSRNLQTAFANFVKNPGNTSPAPNWPTYEANPLVPTLAEIAYHGNVHWDDFVEPIKPNSTVSVKDNCPKRICSN